MNNLVITAASQVNGGDLRTARLGSRFGRMDVMSQLVLLSVEWLGVAFDAMPRERIGICLATRAGSVSTDVEYWKGRNTAGGLSPTLFTYTLPSAAIGEVAIRHRLTGPNLCFVGDDAALLAEAGDMIRRGETEACLCVACDSITAAAAELIRAPVAAQARALFLECDREGLELSPENGRDMATLCARFSARKSAIETTNHASLA
jgi:3-oxoacyl-(acyl-carrier-protein) synthase